MHQARPFLLVISRLVTEAGGRVTHNTETCHSRDPRIVVGSAKFSSFASQTREVMVARVLLIVVLFVCASEATSTANTDGGPLRTCTCCDIKMRSRGYNTYCELQSWHIIMRTAGTKDRSFTSLHFGSPGDSLFKSATSSSTGADERTSLGDATGLYDAFFTLTGITKLALVSGDGLANDPASHSHYVVYDLVDGGTASETLYEIIDRLDTYNKNSPRWHQNDVLFGSPSVTNFTAGIDGYSGTMTSSGGNILTNSGLTPDKICIWGINRDYDNDAQVLCAYSGTLAVGNGKDDYWRGNSPRHTFWSYWGNDWYYDSQQETISVGNQTDPGVVDDADGYRGTIYLMAFA